MIHSNVSKPAIPAYAWVVFALTFGLLISDYMARQVLNAVFPLLKAEWALSDGQLGLLSGIVAVMVGLLTCPISLLADRVGRVKSIAAMAIMWSVATLLCGLAQSYGQMLAARVLVGVGEAAYGSVGIAVIISVFPRHLRATLTAAFMAGGLAGQVLGVGVGGAVAASHGWRLAFLAIGLGGLVLALAYPLIVRESKLAGEGPIERAQVSWANIRLLFAGRNLKCAYVGSGLQLFVAGALPAWLPTYFVRYYDMPLKEATSIAAIFLAIGGAGMIVCGIISDRLVAGSARRAVLAACYCLGCAVLVTAALSFGPGSAQLVLLAAAMFLAGSTAGPSGAMVANLTPAALHGTAFAVLTLANNAFGLAPGPIVTGWLADRIGLLGAMQWLPVASMCAALVFVAAARNPQPELATARAG
ncbi:MFS transporter [Sphingomonas hankyongi]|uniref:MFS transporter n=1 Tax=Sphingomonas hankyongi TaxID=2908209 RepID=A0ABT0S2A6_9SPHN|nr:MFS transporter [Sphingomonas hankyongi]